MTSADRAQADLQTVSTALAAARPDPLPRWLPPAMALAYSAGFALLAVTAWTTDFRWAVPGIVLIVAFLVAMGFVASRGGLRPRVRQGPRQHLVSGVVLLVSLVVFAFDQGSGLLLLGLGFGASAWWQFSRTGRA